MHLTAVLLELPCGTKSPTSSTLLVARSEAGEGMRRFDLSRLRVRPLFALAQRLLRPNRDPPYSDREWPYEIALEIPEAQTHCAWSRLGFIYVRTKLWKSWRLLNLGNEGELMPKGTVAGEADHS